MDGGEDNDDSEGNDGHDNCFDCAGGDNDNISEDNDQNYDQEEGWQTMASYPYNNHRLVSSSSYHATCISCTITFLL